MIPWVTFNCDTWKSEQIFLQSFHGIPKSEHLTWSEIKIPHFHLARIFSVHSLNVVHSNFVSVSCHYIKISAKLRPSFASLFIVSSGCVIKRLVTWKIVKQLMSYFMPTETSKTSITTEGSSPIKHLLLIFNDLMLRKKP